MNATWTTIVVLTALTVAVRAAGPIALGGRPLPPTLTAVIALLAPSLLAALIAVGTLTAANGELELDARAAGLGVAAAVLVYRRESMLTAVAAATLATALLRL